MKRFLNVIIYVLLLFNGTGAIYGGWNLIIHPDGSSIQLSLDLLKHGPFQNYLIPGIVLFIANGLFSFVAIFAMLFHLRNNYLLIMAQGAILTGWIIIQIFLIQTVYFLHFILGGVGLTLLLLGMIKRKSDLERNTK